MKHTVAVIYGGRSGEHEVSIRSAKSILAAIDRDKYDVKEIFITKEGRWEPGPILPEPGANEGIDVVFPVLHGTFGEDGTIQGLFEMADLPYVGSGVLASAAAMDKDVTKRLCRERGLPVVDYVVLFRERWEPELVEERLGYPVFVKPANLGSSVGISKVREPGELGKALELAARYDRKLIVERAIEGRELECSVLGNERPMASAPCEIVPSREFYDYEDKYLDDACELLAPAPLEPGEVDRAQELAVEVYRNLGCEGMARVDLFLERNDGGFLVNEVNTIPGFTSISMYPRLWDLSGVPYPELLDRLIALAVERHGRRSC